MPEHNEPKEKKASTKAERKDPKDPKHKSPKVDDASDELSIEELEDAAGGGDYPPPEPNAAC